MLSLQLCNVFLSISWENDVHYVKKRLASVLKYTMKRRKEMTEPATTSDN